MPTTVTTDPPMQQSPSNRSIFIYMCSHNFWEGLYDTVDIGLISNLFAHHICTESTVLMTTIVPQRISKTKFDELIRKEEKLKSVLLPYGTSIEFLHIPGRTLTAVFRALREIRSRISPYEKKFIWAKNYFNCFISVLVKRQTPGTRLHFEMSGLVPEEELFYSTSSIASRVAKFIVLRLLERINLFNADSISVVSRRFKDYIVRRYRIKPQKIEILPCFFDHQSFYPDKILRMEYRKKYQIAEDQKVILYSGMLQKWQEPDILFSFLRNIQEQDINQEFRLMLLTFDQEKARQYAVKYGLKDMIIEAAGGDELNALYNAADIGLAFRSADMVSYVSSPVKIPEYLATGNSLVMLEYIGDFGLDFQDKKYALLKKNKADLLRTTIQEIQRLEKPEGLELEEIQEKYSIRSNLPGITRVFKGIYD